MKLIPWIWPLVFGCEIEFSSARSAYLKSVRQRHVTSSAEMAQRRQRTRITDEDNRLAANRRSLRQRRRLRPICRAAWRQKIDCVLHCAPEWKSSRWIVGWIAAYTLKKYGFLKNQFWFFSLSVEENPIWFSGKPTNFGFLENHLFWFSRKPCQR